MSDIPAEELKRRARERLRASPDESTEAFRLAMAADGLSPEEAAILTRNREAVAAYTNREMDRTAEIERADAAISASGRDPYMDSPDVYGPDDYIADRRAGGPGQLPRVSRDVSEALVALEEDDR